MKDNELAKLGIHWEYVVDDFLEVGCFLSPEKRKFLISALRTDEMAIESVEIHPCFSMNRRLVCIVKSSPVRDLWLYDPLQKRLEKHNIRKT